MTPVTRFAPSPTGRLHVGNIRTALHNYLFARAHGGTFLLRLDDTDAERSTAAFARGIRDDLAWLGLVPDAEQRQSDRFARYEQRFEQLRAAGRVYPAFESAEELDLKRKVLLGRHLPPVYDRAALALTDADRARLEAEGRRPHWRFRLDHESPIAWDDLIRGPQHLDPGTMSDPVIRRADGSWLYMLPSAIDDIDMRVTHVVRGEDHVTNSGHQIQMFQALGAEPPRFAHAALLVGTEGKLSKRDGALGVADLQADGIEPLAVLALLARLGTSRPVEPVGSIDALIAGFDFAHLGRAPARFDPHDLAALNARMLHVTPYARVVDRLPEGMGEAEWNAVRGNIARVADAADWQRVIMGPIDAPSLDEDDRAFIARAADAAERLDWSDAPWEHLTAALKAATGRKGKPLFLPLRRALTGRYDGPSMADLLPLIGREEAVKRLRSASAPVAK
ncbi:MAG: Glutamyl-tRNA(Gln) synthetase [uncultured Sphingomonadaceae bacterium]|uniref:Glutamate--tRNA ligase n=1 Tax=uncultured Sphingomonadaceae bacterium TaxID=169976 RepID=A0A6J4TSI0_9SPHN|nr:MAG: Glutamyl-tRNA(Gln) synthetase [uncultured Sphingomonadaceae bacterium]